MASFLIVLALCCNCFAAEPMEASFCSVWPLAAGNAWLTLNPRFEVVSQNTYNGYTAWRMQFTLHGIAGDTTVSAYWTFANEWLYETANEADLAMLPEIADGMYRVFPAVFRDGETFTMEGFIGRGAPINLTPVVTNAGVQVNAEGIQVPILTLVRGMGPGSYDLPFVHATIVGTCSGLYETEISTSSPKWVEAGQFVRLEVPVSSGSRFQWYKDGAALEDASTSTYVKDPVALEDSGNYTCRVWEGPVLFHDTRAVFVSVFPEGTLPVAGKAGWVVLAFALVVMGCTAIQRAHDRIQA
ncbi:MAG TPA: immunoglobulin domain-containing protein [Candidatus Hydrogenedentes bacterium]|nr:immunoglobulin domain-containing protein [Candidatus Hydrogenedentota bacterium]